jgi:hypothetical protein
MHLSREELHRWWEEGAPGDAERIVGHLAICDECVTLYRDVLTERPLTNAPAAPPELVAAGLAAFPRVSENVGPDRGRSRARWIVPLAAAAALVVVIVSPWLRAPALVAPTDETVRSSTIQALSPAGTVSAAFVFEWSSPLTGDDYELVVYDASGSTLWSTRTRTTRLAAPPDLTRRLKPGDAHEWQVTAINQRGERTIQSSRQRFAVSPGP